MLTDADIGMKVFYRALESFAGAQRQAAIFARNLWSDSPTRGWPTLLFSSPRWRLPHRFLPLERVGYVRWAKGPVATSSQTDCGICILDLRNWPSLLNLTVVQRSSFRADETAGSSLRKMIRFANHFASLGMTKLSCESGGTAEALP